MKRLKYLTAVMAFLLYFTTGLFAADNKIKVLSITASSTLQDKNDSSKYAADNLIDGKNASWVEGENDNGEGSSITIKFDGKVTINQIVIRNGYGDIKYWEQNNRVKELGICPDNIGYVTARLYDNPGYQLIEFTEPVPVSRQLELTIESVYEGSKYQDTAIAEISFNDWNTKTENLANLIGREADEITNNVHDYFFDKTAERFVLFAKNEYNKDISQKDNRHEESVLDYSLNLDLSNERDGSYVACWGVSEEIIDGNREAEDEYFALFSKIDGSTITFDQKYFPYFVTEKDLNDLKKNIRKNDKNSQAFVSYAEAQYKKVNDGIKSCTPILWSVDELPLACSTYHIGNKDSDPALQEFINCINPVLTQYDSRMEYLPPVWFKWEVNWK